MNTIRLKSQFLLNPELVFFNHGSCGACPKEVFNTYQNYQLLLEKDPFGFLISSYPELRIQSATALADYLGTNRKNLVFFPNPTSAMRVIARVFPLKKDDEILTTNYEYGTMEQCFNLVSHLTGARYIHQNVPLPMHNKEEFIDAFWEGVNPNTRIIFLSHVSYFSSLIFPVEEIIQRARQAGIMTVVDGAHAPALIPDLNLDTIGADVYVGACHKWMSAPKGVGFLYVRPEVQDPLNPILYDENFVKNLPDPRPVVFGKHDESLFNIYYNHNGTDDPSAILSVPAAIEFMKNNQWDEVRRQCQQTARETLIRITEFTQMEPISPISDLYFKQLVSIPLPIKEWDDIEEFNKELRGKNIVAPVMRVNDHTIIRVSIQGYNSNEEVDLLINTIQTGLENIRRN